MEIPTTGRDVLFVLQPASPEDKQPAVIRPAKIISIWSYGPRQAVVNLSVILDGDRDATLASRLTLGTNCRVSDDMMFLYFTSSQYDPKLSAPGTWCYDRMEIHSVEEIIVDLDITHGREIISAGAVGIWDQKKDSLTFDRKNVGGISDDQLPVYPANKFFNLHMPRLTMPENYFPMMAVVESDGSESPDERRAFMGDLNRILHDRRYAQNRMAGMPAPETGSIAKARQLMKDRRRITAETSKSRDMQMGLPADEAEANENQTSRRSLVEAGRRE